MPSNISTFIIIIIDKKINIIYMNILFFKWEHSILFKQTTDNERNMAPTFYSGIQYAINRADCT